MQKPKKQLSNTFPHVALLSCSGWCDRHCAVLACAAQQSHSPPLGRPKFAQTSNGCGPNCGSEANKANSKCSKPNLHACTGQWPPAFASYLWRMLQDRPGSIVYHRKMRWPVCTPVRCLRHHWGMTSPNPHFFNHTVAATQIWLW